MMKPFTTTNLLAICTFLFALISCSRNHPVPERQMVGGPCSYEKTMDTFTIDSFVNDSVPYYVISSLDNPKAINRDLNLLDIYFHNGENDSIFSKPEMLLGKKIILSEQRIITGACVPYGLNDVKIIE